MFAKAYFDNVAWQLFVVVIAAVGDGRPELLKSVRIQSLIWAVIQIVARKTQIGFCLSLGDDHFLSQRFVFVTIFF